MTTKISKAFIFLTIGFLLYVPNAFAVMRAPFPNSSALQPLPTTVAPNITKNVNSSSSTTEPAFVDSSSTPTLGQPEQATNVPGNTGFGAYFYGGIIVGLVSLFSLRYFLRKKK